MNLNGLGFDRALEAQAAPLLTPGRSVARISAVDRGGYRVRTADAELRAVLTGRFRFSAPAATDRPCVGDWVCIERLPSGMPALIHAVLPRKNFLRRKCAGPSVDYQMIAANLDGVFILQGCRRDFNLARLQRYLVMAADGGVRPFLVLSKTDLVTAGELERRLDEIRRAGISAPVLPLSNETDRGLDAVRDALVPSRTYGLLGSSGVGKTTLINKLSGRELLPVRDVSQSGKGVHTTTRRQLIVLENGALLIDTPGLRELGLIGDDGGPGDAFADIAEYAGQCRFPDCTHVQEPGCAVRAALESGGLSPERYRNYSKLAREMAFHRLSYVEKRRKEKAFGKRVKSALRRLQDE